MSSKIQTGLRLPEAQYEKIKENAKRAGVSINQYILMLIDTGLIILEKGRLE